MPTMRNILSFASAALGALVLAACGGGEKQPAAGAPPAAAPAAAAPAGTETPDPGGKVITVLLITDATGNYFQPKEVEARQGDVVRYTVSLGVHNVEFTADSNPGKKNLPKTSDLLQLPGQTYDVKVNLDPGKYYFQCIPHAALGMRGHLTVLKK